MRTKSLQTVTKQQNSEIGMSLVSKLKFLQQTSLIAERCAINNVHVVKSALKGTSI